MLVNHFLDTGQYQDAVTESLAAIHQFSKSYEASQLVWDCWVKSSDALRNLVFEKIEGLAELENPYWVSLVFYAKAYIETNLLQEAVGVCGRAIAMADSNGLPY